MRWRALAVGLVCVAVAGSLIAQERTSTKQAADSSKKGDSWLTRWLPFSGKSDQAKKDVNTKETPAPESASAVRARELAALQRRQAICLRLKEIANQTNDEALTQKAERLEQLAWQVFEQRTRNAAVSTSTVTPGADR